MAMQGRIHIYALICLFFGCFIAPFGAIAQDLGFPLQCQPGQNCWIISYPDLNGAQDNAQDYACGPRANDGDVSLRIGLSSVAALEDSIPVIAAGDGKVRDVLDGVRDLVLAGKHQLPKGTSLCGNGVVIDHGLGVQTAYCHMREGSIIVKKGTHVTKGQEIGRVGQSGLAYWPQLGFSVMQRGVFVDPITGMTTLEGCGFRPRPVFELPEVWHDYQSGAIVSLGWSDRAVTEDALVLGKAPRFARIDRSAASINLWAMLINVQVDDKIVIRLRDPRGRTFHFQEVTATQNKKRQIINITRKRGYGYWRTGAYTGEISVTRAIENGPETVSRAVNVLIK